MSHHDCQPPGLFFETEIDDVRGSTGAFFPPAKATEAPLKAMARDNAARVILELMFVASLCCRHGYRAKFKLNINKT
jgi:hypothetical protein